MANQEIDLLKVHPDTAVRRLSLLRKAKVASFLILIFYCLFAGGILFYWLKVREKNEQVAKQIKERELSLRNLKPTESAYALLKQKSTALNKLLLEERTDFGTILSEFSSFISPEVEISSVELNEEGNLSFSGKTANAVLLADFLDLLLSEKGEEIIKSASLTSSSREEDGSYSFRLLIDVQI